MANLTLTEAQRTLLGIVTSVESGVTAPEVAVDELARLKSRALEAGLKFSAPYTLEDFKNLRANQLSQYETSEPYVEPSYESSDSY
jgi:hypothetical protein